MGRRIRLSLSAVPRREFIRGLTPRMVKLEIEILLLAYNLMRYVMARGRKRRGEDPIRNRQHVGGRQILPVCRSIRVPGRKIVRESILTTRQGHCLRRVAETEAKGLCQGSQTQAKALSAADETTWRIHAMGGAMRLKLAAFGSDPFYQSSHPTPHLESKLTSRHVIHMHHAVSSPRRGCA